MPFTGAPSWPVELLPQQYIAPLVLTAQVWIQPVATCTQSVALPTCTGFVRPVPDVPSPIWP